MNCLVVFHSVTGCCYEMAAIAKRVFEISGIPTDVRRIPSFKQKEFSKQFEKADEFYSRITEVKKVNISKIRNYDILVICSPTYFGNVSAEIKLFMDSMADLWMHRYLADKYLIAMTSAASITGGGSLCLQAINTFGMHLGMIPVACRTPEMPAYGLLHSAGPFSEKRPDNDPNISAALQAIASELAIRTHK